MRTDGKLAGWPGQRARDSWHLGGLTDNVNQLSANLTMQVRAIAEVAAAVSKGDHSRPITVEARGEVADRKDNVNAMIRNLREITRQNTEQDWLNRINDVLDLSKIETGTQKVVLHQRWGCPSSHNSCDNYVIFVIVYRLSI